MIKRSEAKILFKPPWRANIFLQVIILALYISFLCLDGGRALHFLTSLLHFTVLSHPFPADSNARVRAGWRPRATLVLCHAHPCWQLADQHTDLLPVQVLIEQSKWVLGIWKTKQKFEHFSHFRLILQNGRRGPWSCLTSVAFYCGKLVDVILGNTNLLMIFRSLLENPQEHRNRGWSMPTGKGRWFRVKIEGINKPSGQPDVYYQPLLAAWG